MFNTLFSRLALALLAVFVGLGAVFILLARSATESYFDELTQQLNRSIAMYVRDEAPLLENSRVNTAQLQVLAQRAMVINPVAEVYLLDASGRVLGNTVSGRALQRDRLALAPIIAYLAGNQLPISGDDPLSLTGQKVFSAAAIESHGKVDGYVYVVLGSSHFVNLKQALAGSYILRVSFIALAITLLGVLLVTLLLFREFTKPIRDLATDMRQLREELLPDRRPHRSAGQSDLQALRQTFDDMANRIREQLRCLDNADRLRRELIANVSHDLRTPLSSMRGYIDTLLLKNDVLAATSRADYLAIASKQGEHLSRLVSQLFELSKLESNAVSLSVEQFSLAELLQDVAQKFQLKAEQQQVRLLVSCESHGMVRADIGLMERVLDNLLENALRHTPSGGQIQLQLTATAGMQAVTLSDSGCGIAAEQLPRIFERHFHGDQAASAGERTGLGLAIVKRILELHDADIVVESELQRGTTFRFALPLAA